MAGIKIICEGDIILNSGKDTTIHAFGSDIVTTAGNKNIWYGENGTLVGEYKKIELPAVDDDNCCDCPKPQDNFPYTENTFYKIKEISTLVNFYAKKYNVPPIAIAGSIADEYNTINSNKFRKVIDGLQDDYLLKYMPNFAIEIDVYLGNSSKFLNASKNDLGIGNIKLETAKKLYDEYKTEFDNKNWNYKDIVNYIQTNKGTVHLAALVIKKAQQLLGKYINDYCDCKKEAILVTYYKQGDSYVEKFFSKNKKNSKHKIQPGEGCRVSLQREKFLKIL